MIFWFLPRNILIAPILLWRKLISPIYGNVCRYHPSCSTYGLGAVQRFGILKGAPLAIWRIMRCNPWSKGGIDVVPKGPDWIVIGRLGFISPDVSRQGS